MANAIVRQFRFYGYSDGRNYDGGTGIGVTYNGLVNGSLFFSKDNNATQIGIQALPGTKFYLNDGLQSGYGIVIGRTGIYELDTTNLGMSITNLQFDSTSVDTINTNNNAYLIVDIIYGGNASVTEEVSQ